MHSSPKFACVECGQYSSACSYWQSNCDKTSHLFPLHLVNPFGANPTIFTNFPEVIHGAEWANCRYCYGSPFWCRIKDCWQSCRKAAIKCNNLCTSDVCGVQKHGHCVRKSSTARSRAHQASKAAVSWINSSTGTWGSRQFTEFFELGDIQNSTCAQRYSILFTHWLHLNFRDCLVKIMHSGIANSKHLLNPAR